jgi:hypothetical protein
MLTIPVVYVGFRLDGADTARVLLEIPTAPADAEAVPGALPTPAGRMVELPAVPVVDVAGLVPGAALTLTLTPAP